MQCRQLSIRLNHLANFLFDPFEIHTTVLVFNDIIEVCVIMVQFQDSNQEETDENLDFRALEDGFVSISFVWLIFSTSIIVKHNDNVKKKNHPFCFYNRYLLLQYLFLNWLNPTLKRPHLNGFLMQFKAFDWSAVIMYVYLKMQIGFSAFSNWHHFEFVLLRYIFI